MRTLVLIVLSTLFTISTPLANANSIDAASLAKMILNSHKHNAAESGSFNIVYGGQDISHSKANVQAQQIEEPILIG